MGPLVAAPMEGGRPTSTSPHPTSLSLPFLSTPFPSCPPLHPPQTPLKPSSNPSLSPCRQQQQDWLALGLVADVEEYVGASLAEASDWELNFRMLKAASRDAEKLPNEACARARARRRRSRACLGAKTECRSDVAAFGATSSPPLRRRRPRNSYDPPVF